jgi:hypothetical protein
MKQIPFVLLILVSIASRGQLALKVVQDSLVQKYHIGASSDFNLFAGHAGYGAPYILTNVGGGAAFGDGDEGTMLMVLNKAGKLQWKRLVKPKGDTQEPQSMAEDTGGNFYVFQLVYDHTKYRGGTERVVCINKVGTILWDKYLGTFTMMNNPTVAYIKSLPDGRIYMRGQVVTTAPPEGKDPEYHFWEGWLTKTGALTQKTGEVIDWKNSDWKKRFSPE